RSAGGWRPRACRGHLWWRRAAAGTSAAARVETRSRGPRLGGARVGTQGDGSMDTASGAPQAYPSTPGLYHLTTQADGHTVSYTLRIPAGYDGRTALPVILCLHFGGQPTEFYGGRFLNLIPLPGFGSLAALLVAPTTAQSGWATPTGEAAAFAALAEVEQHLRVAADHPLRRAAYGAWRSERRRAIITIVPSPCRDGGNATWATAWGGSVRR